MPTPALSDQVTSSRLVSAGTRRRRAHGLLLPFFDKTVVSAPQRNVERPIPTDDAAISFRIKRSSKTILMTPGTAQEQCPGKKADKSSSACLRTVVGAAARPGNTALRAVFINGFELVFRGLLPFRCFNVRGRLLHARATRVKRLTSGSKMTRKREKTRVTGKCYC